MEDLLGMPIEVGALVFYPEGAKFRTGVVKKVGQKTMKIIGIFKDDWRTDVIISKNKAFHLCIQVNAEQFISHERREYHRTYGETRIVATTRNNETREVTRVFQTCEEYIHERLRLVRQLQCILLKMEPVNQLLPTKSETEILTAVLEERRYVLNTRRY